MTEACLLQRTNSRIFTKSYTSSATTENWLNAGSPAMLSTNQWQAEATPVIPQECPLSYSPETTSHAVLLYDLYLHGIGLFLSTLALQV